MTAANSRKTLAKKVWQGITVKKHSSYSTTFCRKSKKIGRQAAFDERRLFGQSQNVSFGFTFGLWYKSPAYRVRDHEAENFTQRRRAKQDCKESMKIFADLAVLRQLFFPARLTWRRSTSRKRILRRRICVGVTSTSSSSAMYSSASSSVNGRAGLRMTFLS